MALQRDRSHPRALTTGATTGGAGAGGAGGGGGGGSGAGSGRGGGAGGVSVRFTGSGFATLATLTGLANLLVPFSSALAGGRG